jgi:two-component system NtrC family sensor kinase
MTTLPLVFATIGVALHSATAVVMALLSRAEGWRRLRWFAVVAGTAALYSGVDAWNALHALTADQARLTVRVQLVNSALHVAAWLVYTYAAEEDGWRGLSGRLRAAVAGVLVVPIGLAAAAPITTDRIIDLVVPLGPTRIFAAELAPLGNVAAATLIAGLVLALAERVRRWRAGERGEGLIVAGFVVFLLCGAEEALVSAGVIRFPYLADVGFLAIVVPVAGQTIGRIREDAARLAELSARLTDTVEQRTAERDAARSRLVEQERLAALGRLAAGVGHEVNNPLAYVGANLELLREELGPDASPTLTAALDDADDGVRRIREVVAGLRTYARPGSEAFDPLDLAGVARDAVRVGTAGARGEVEVRLVPADGPVPAIGNAGRLVQVGVNLVVNAIEAAAANAEARPPHVAVSVHRADDGWGELRVTDTGAGFAPEVLARLGEPYVTTRARDGGSGLGLFVSRGILDAHGGALLVETVPGGGTRVRVRLPAVADAAAAAPRPASSSGPAAAAAVPALRPPVTPARRVVLVDDEPLVLDGLARALRRHGHDVRTFQSAAEALDAIASGAAADVVVTDLMMPDMDGAVFADRLAARAPRLRASLIVITGGATTDETRAFCERPDVTVVRKPVDARQLAAAIGRVPAS